MAFQVNAGNATKKTALYEKQFNHQHNLKYSVNKYYAKIIIKSKHKKGFMNNLFLYYTRENILETNLRTKKLCKLIRELLQFTVIIIFVIFGVSVLILISQ